MPKLNILFKAEMVRPTLAGTKTQTRRILKPQPHPEFLARGLVGGKPVPQWPHQDGVRWFMADGMSVLTKCPYGAPGTQLYVKETFRFASNLDAKSPSAIAESALGAGYTQPWAPIKYEADHATVNEDCLQDFGGSWGKKRVSIHMPRWASRITLEVTEIRVERLQDISDEDAIAEGMPIDDAVYDYSRLWDKINGPGSWDLNPYVWVISFKRI